MTAEHSNTKKGLWLRWVVANAIGLALGLALWGIISDTLGEHGPIDSQLVVIPSSIVAFLSVGAVAGTLQWLALRSYIDLSRWNILVGSIGYAVGFIVGFILGGPPVDFILGFILFGLGTGIVQALSLRRQVSRAGWWVPTIMLSLVVGGAVGMVVIFPIGDALDAALGGGVVAFVVILTLLGATAGAVAGAISGALLLRLLRQPTADTVTSTPSMTT
jgi:hypothetical protein